MGIGLGGIIGGAMQGVGEGGKQYGDYLSKSTLQEEAAEIQKLRDARLAEVQKGHLRYAEDLRREPGKNAQAEIDAANAKPAYDEGTDSVRPRTPQERAAIEEGAYRRQGLVGEALRTRELEQQRADRSTQHDVQREQIASNDKYHNALLAIHGAAEGRLTKSANLDNSIKEISLANAKRVEDLRKEFGAAGTTPERKKGIQEEIQLLTGKDNDNYLPVPTGFDEMTGKPNGYRVFDKKRGTWVDDGGAAPAKPGAANRPPLASFFGDGKKKTDAAAPASPAAAALEAPAAAPSQAPYYEQFIKAKPRGGFVIDAPPRSRAAKFNGRSFSSREDALRELGAFTAYEEE